MDSLPKDNHPVKTNTVQQTKLENNNRPNISEKNYINNNYKNNIGIKQTSVEDRIVYQFKLFIGDNTTSKTQPSKDLYAFFYDARKKFMLYKKDIFAHYKNIQLNNMKHGNLKNYFLPFYNSLVKLKQNLKEEQIFKNILQNNNSTYNEKNLKREIDSIILCIDKIIDEHDNKPPTKFKKLLKYIHNISAYILTKLDGILTYFRSKINLFTNAIFKSSKKTYLNIDKYKTPYKYMADNTPKSTHIKPTEIQSIQREKSNSQKKLLKTTLESDEPVISETSNAAEINNEEDTTLDNIELQKQGISLSKLSNVSGNICWFNAMLKMFYRMHHDNINDIIDNYKQLTNDISDEAMIKKRNDFLNSLENLFSSLKENQDIEQQTYDFLNNIYVYTVSIEAENSKSEKENKTFAPGVNTIIKLLKDAAEDKDGILSINPALIKQEMTVEFLTALIEILNISNETNTIITATQNSIRLNNKIDNQKNSMEIKRAINETKGTVIIYSLLENSEEHTDQKKLNSEIINEITENQKYNDFDQKEASDLKNKIQQQINADGDIAVDCQLRTKSFSMANIDKLSEFLIEFNSADEDYKKEPQKMQETFAKNYPLIKLEIVDKNNLSNKYKIEAQATSIIIHIGDTGLAGHYVTFNIDKNGKAILHDDTETLTLDRLYTAFLSEKISPDQFNKKTEQEKFIYILQLYQYDPNVVLYKVTNKKLI